MTVLAAGNEDALITVYGDPAPQGSKTCLGKGWAVDANKRTKPWRRLVTAAAKAVLDEAEARTGERPGPMVWAVAAEVTFSFHKSEAARRRGDTWPVLAVPDTDKLLRAILDALTDARIWQDDRQVVELTGRRVWCSEGLDALDRPGALIRVWDLAAS